LPKWHREGTVYLDGAAPQALRLKGHGGQWETWYLEADIDRIVAARRAQTGGRFELPAGPYLTHRAAKRDLGLARTTINHLVDAGRVQTALVRNPETGHESQKVYREADLREYLRARPAKWDGTRAEAGDRRLTLTRAAREFGICRQVLWKYIN